MALSGLVVSCELSLLRVILDWLPAGRWLGFAGESSLWVSRTSALLFLVLAANQTSMFGSRKERWQKLQVNGILYSVVRGFHSRKTAWPPSLVDR